MSGPKMDRSMDTTDFPMADAIAAAQAVGAFWGALGDDDDEATAALFYGPSIEKNGFTRKGLAAQLRKAMRTSLTDCRVMGVASWIRVLRDGRWAFMSITTAGRPIAFNEPALAYGWLLVATRDDGPWQVWGEPGDEAMEGYRLVDMGFKPDWSRDVGPDESNT